LSSLFEEIVQRFPEQYLHLGGDEVDYLCWKSNPEINSFMESIGIVGDYRKLEEYYLKRLIEIIQSLNKSYIVWQEVFDKSINISSDTVVNVWKSDYNPEIYELTKLGFRVILSSCWYLNKISYGYDWFQYYSCDPLSFNGTQEQNRLVIGGEASIWGEWVDGNNFMSITWFV
jgi:hexosaminidase